MSTRQRFASVALVGALLLAGPTWAAAPPLLPVTGALSDADGRPIDGSVSLRFALFADAGGSVQLWEEERLVPVSDGYFAVYLGESVPVDLQLFRDYAALYLGVTVDGEAMDLVQLASSPFAGYAQFCGNATQVAGLSVDQVYNDFETRLGADVHPRYADAEAVAAMGSLANTNPLNHPRFTPSDAVTAMGAAGETNPLNHDRFTDAEAVAAVQNAGTLQLPANLVTPTASPLSYQPGDVLIHASEHERTAPEDNVAGWVELAAARLAKNGAVRVRFEAYIQSGNDYFAWELRNSTGAALASGTYAVGLDPSNTANVHAYRLFAVEVAGVQTNDRLSLWLKASDGAGAGLGSLGTQTLYARAFRIYSASPSTAQPVSGAAVFQGALSNDGALETADAGYASFVTTRTSSARLFTPITTGNYGVRLEASGDLQVSYNQDIICNGGSYCWVRLWLDSVGLGTCLIAPTGGFWDNLSCSVVTPVRAGQVLTVEFGASGSDLAALDPAPWSNLALFWVGAYEP